MENWWCNFNKIRRNILIRVCVCLCVWVRRVFSLLQKWYAFGTYCFSSHTLQLTLNIMQWYGAHIHIVHGMDVSKTIFFAKIIFKWWFFLPSHSVWCVVVFAVWIHSNANSMFICANWKLVHSKIIEIKTKIVSLCVYVCSFGVENQKKRQRWAK